jgi:AcrR family transcriptional regulator
MPEARDELLTKVMAYAAREGLADRSLREIAAGAGTSHRMLIYHFKSRAGLLAAVVGAMEAQQRAAMTALAGTATTPEELMRGIWAAVSSPEIRPFVRLFFEVFALASRGVEGAGLPRLTESWLDDAAAAAERLGVEPDRAMLRLGVAVYRGLLLDLLAGATIDEVDAAHERYVELALQNEP